MKQVRTRAVLIMTVLLALSPLAAVEDEATLASQFKISKGAVMTPQELAQRFGGAELAPESLAGKVAVEATLVFPAPGLDVLLGRKLGRAVNATKRPGDDVVVAAARPFDLPELPEEICRAVYALGPGAGNLLRGPSFTNNLFGEDLTFDYRYKLVLIVEDAQQGTAMLNRLAGILHDWWIVDGNNMLYIRSLRQQVWDGQDELSRKLETLRTNLARRAPPDDQVAALRVKLQDLAVELAGRQARQQAASNALLQVRDLDLPEANKAQLLQAVEMIRINAQTDMADLLARRDCLRQQAEEGECERDYQFSLLEELDRVKKSLSNNNETLDNLEGYLIAIENDPDMHDAAYEFYFIVHPLAIEREKAADSEAGR